MLKKIIFMLIYYILITACSQQVKSNSKNLSAKSNLQKKESLTVFYEKAILDYYKKANTDDYKIELELSGEIAYEDNSVLILSFKEILKFGSWHYTDSSLLFLKDGNKLIPISSSSPNLKLLNDDYYERDIKYQNRIQGIFKERVDLTGDGKPEYIFLASGSIKTSLEEKYSIYHLNTDSKSLVISNLHISSNKTQGECNNTFGTVRKYKIIKMKSSLPIIEVNEIQSICDYSLSKVKELSSKSSYYQWNKQKKVFEEVSYKNKLIHIKAYK